MDINKWIEKKGAGIGAVIFGGLLTLAVAVSQMGSAAPGPHTTKIGVASVAQAQTPAQSQPSPQSSSEVIPQGYAQVKAWIESHNDSMGPSKLGMQSSVAPLVIVNRPNIASSGVGGSPHLRRDDLTAPDRPIALGPTPLATSPNMREGVDAPGSVRAIERLNARKTVAKSTELQAINSREVLDPIPQGREQVRAWIERNTSAAANGAPSAPLLASAPTLKAVEKVAKADAPAAQSAPVAPSSVSFSAVPEGFTGVTPKSKPKTEPQRAVEVNPSGPEWFAAELVAGGLLVFGGLAGAASMRSSKRRKEGEERAEIDAMLDSATQRDWSKKA